MSKRLERLKQASLVLFCLVATFFCGATYGAHPNSKVIITDLLDDDIRALINLLSDDNIRPKIKAIVTSTGNTQLKAAIARKMVSGLGLDIPVYAGTSTDLSNNQVTSFAANYEREGSPLLSDQEIDRLRPFNGISGDASEQLSELFRSQPSGEHLDILLITAPTDLVKAVHLDRAAAKKAIGDVFVMGLYKENKSRELVSPYNTMADPQSVVEFFSEYERGIFENVYHVPSDTVQARSGLPGGYIPEDGEGAIVRTRLTQAMSNNPVLKKVLQAAEEYGFNWRTSAAQTFGWGLGTDLDRWVPSTFQSPDAAVGFYLADTIPAVLLGFTQVQLDKLRFKPRVIVPPSSVKPGKPFAFGEESPGARGKRSVQDLEEFDGWTTLRRYVALVEDANRFAPTADYSKPVEIKHSIGDHLPTVSDARYYAHKDPRALVITFKNSPDDWFALIRILATEGGRESLLRGGIICEGFETEAARQSVQSFLRHLGEPNIRVAGGYQYAPDEVAAIPNFKGEIALYKHGQSAHAFETLNDGTNQSSEKRVSPTDIVQHAVQWAKISGGKVDVLILGEGIDILRQLNGNPELAKPFANFYVMGGGRIGAENDKLILSRNWLPHSTEIIDSLESLGQSGKRIFIFSSNEFGGSLVAKTNGPLGNAAVAFNKLEAASKDVPALKSVFTYWQNWTRIFNWVIGNKDGSPFNPHESLPLLTISPLGLIIADEWIRGELDQGNSSIQSTELSLKDKLEGRLSDGSKKTGIYWLKRNGGQEIVALAKRFSEAIDSVIVSRASQAHHEALRDASIASPQARESLHAVQIAVKCSDLLTSESAIKPIDPQKK